MAEPGSGKATAECLPLLTYCKQCFSILASRAVVFSWIMNTWRSLLRFIGLRNCLAQVTKTWDPFIILAWHAQSLIKSLQVLRTYVCLGSSRLALATPFRQIISGVSDFDATLPSRQVLRWIHNRPASHSSLANPAGPRHLFVFVQF